MNPLIELKTQPSLFRLVLCLAWFGLVTLAEAVFPPPDGGYPGFNTAEGQNALFSLTTGQGNTAVGWLSLRALTQGSFNTAIGAGALLSNIGEVNTATGTGALLSNTTGGNNTANGVLALFSNTVGASNTACGSGALLSNTIGDNNTANGFHALFSNTEGGGNTANGDSVLFSNVTGLGNTASGVNALYANTSGSGNTAIGGRALVSNTSGGLNIAIGDSALQNNTSGNNNAALGLGAGGAVTTATDVICIGANVFGANISNTCFIGNIRGVTTANFDAIPVLIDSAGQLGTTSSSRRFKTEIKPMANGSEAILALKPVTFHYKSDKAGTPQFGLIAEDVAAVNADLVVRDKDSEIYTVRYDAVNAMLLNEFLKEHRKVQEQESTIAQLKKEIQTVIARLKEHDSKIQRVSAQIGISKAIGQTASNDP
jgi:Chaperone of endosialidase